MLSTKKTWSTCYYQCYFCLYVDGGLPTTWRVDGTQWWCDVTLQKRRFYQWKKPSTTVACIYIKYIYISWYGRIARHVQCLNKTVIGTWDVFIYDFSPKSFKNSLTIHELNNQSRPPKSVTCSCFKGPAKHSLLPRGGILFQSRECTTSFPGSLFSASIVDWLYFAPVVFFTWKFHPH